MGDLRDRESLFLSKGPLICARLSRRDDLDEATLRVGGSKDSDRSCSGLCRDFAAASWPSLSSKLSASSARASSSSGARTIGSFLSDLSAPLLA